MYRNADKGTDGGYFSALVVHQLVAPSNEAFGEVVVVLRSGHL
jgi:hypothetical protein